MITGPALIERLSGILTQRHRQIIHQEELPDFARAAVLIPLLRKNGEVSVILTVRTHSVETHKGQVSFPGGMMSSEDAHVTDTALREAEEELGIPGSAVRTLGLLDDHLVPTKFIITPVVGYLDAVPEYIINPAEVEEVFDVPLAFFMDGRNGRPEEREIRGRKVMIWYFSYGKHLIWGATAAMINHLVTVLKSTGEW